MSASTAPLDVAQRLTIRRNTNAVLGSIMQRCARLIRAQAAEPGALVRNARLVRLDAEDGVTWAVLAERAAGASWVTVALWLSEDPGFVADHYGEIERCYHETGRIRLPA